MKAWVIEMDEVGPNGYGNLGRLFGSDQATRYKEIFSTYKVRFIEHADRAALKEELVKLQKQVKKLRDSYPHTSPLAAN